MFRNCLKASYLKTLLATLMLTVSLAAHALTWTDPNTGIKWTYTKVNGTASIGGGKSSSPAVPTSQSGDLIVPEKINGLDVTQMKAYAFFDCKNLTSITFTSEISVPATASCLFRGCSKVTEINLEKINTSKATNLSHLFENCYLLNKLEGLEKWDVSNVTNINSIFKTCTALNDLTEIKNWDVSSVTNMGSILAGCTGITDLTPLANWNTGNVTRLGGTFSGCTGITDLTPLANWDVSNVTDMSDDNSTSYYGMFRGCKGITDLTPLANWNTGNVTNMSYMFYECTSITDFTPLAGWDVSSVTNMQMMFYGCTGVIDLTPLANWNTGNATNMSCMFSRCSNLKNLTGLQNWNTGNVKNMRFTFSGCTGITDLTPLANWDVSNVTDMMELFYQCTGITDLTPLVNWNVSKVTSMAMMFSGCTGIIDLTPLANWDVSNVSSMDQMFMTCKGITDLTPLANWDVSNVTSMTHMFNGCTELNNVTAIEKWILYSVKFMDYMFDGCVKLTEIDMLNWNPIKLESAKNFFRIDKKLSRRIRLPQNMKIIPQQMLEDSYIEEITIPSTVTKIELYALPYRYLTQITFPSNVTEIQSNWVFSNSASNIKEIFCMPETPPDISASGSGTINKTLYVKTSALEAYRNHEQWGRFAVITDQIPVTIAAGKQYATLALDFDADFSQTEGLTPYTAAAYYEGTTAAAKVASAYQQAGMPAKARAAAKDNTIRTVVIAKFPDNYIPSRTGQDNFTFHGALLYGKPGTYYYRMGEDDYASGQQKTEIGQNNYMMPAYETWQLSPTYTEEPQNWMCYPKDDSYNFVLKDGKFKYIDNAGTIARHKAWLALPADLVSGSYHEAGAKMSMVFEDTDPNSAETTGITFIEETVDPKTGQTAYNLRGQAVTDSYKGIVVRNGKAFLNNK